LQIQTEAGPAISLYAKSDGLPQNEHFKWSFGGNSAFSSFGVFFWDGVFTSALAVCFLGMVFGFGVAFVIELEGSIKDFVSQGDVKSILLTSEVSVAAELART
jgi:hypothetical protein